MKNPEREEDFRCRPPRPWKGLVVFICILATLLPLANGCQGNETSQCNTDGCICVKCLVCPPGEGLYPQCGIPLKGNMTMKCIPCKSGMYSDQNDFGSCHACDVCVGQQTLRICTAKKNAICKKGCKDGFRWNEIYQICEEVPPTNKEKTTTPQTTLIGASTTLVPGSVLTSTNTSTSNNASSEPNDSVNKTKQSTSMKPPSRWSLHVTYVLVTVFPLILLVIGFQNRGKIRSYVRNLYCSCRGWTSQDESEKSPMNQPEHKLKEITVDNSSAGATAALSDIPGLYDQLLKDLPLTLKKDKISVKLCKRDLEGWMEIGSYFKVDNEEIEKIEIRCSNGSSPVLPSEGLIDFLEARMPYLTVGEFIVALRSIGREDVVLLIHKWYHTT